MNELVISNCAIRMDKQGRFCLNDLHRAAGGESRHQPGKWLELQQTSELIEEVKKTGIPVIFAKQGVGTFVAKELVYSYAMWINAAFHLKVIKAYDELASGTVDWKKLRHEASSSFKSMNRVLQMTRERAGKSSEPHHYSNEARLINFALSGEFKGVDRDALSRGDLDLLAQLEALNTILLAHDIPYADRKTQLAQFAEERRVRVLTVSEPVAAYIGGAQ